MCPLIGTIHFKSPGNCTAIEKSPIVIQFLGTYCKSTKFGVLLNLVFLALGQKLNRIIQGKTFIIAQKVVNPPNYIAAKYS